MLFLHVDNIVSKHVFLLEHLLAGPRLVSLRMHGCRLSNAFLALSLLVRAIRFRGYLLVQWYFLVLLRSSVVPHLIARSPADCLKLGVLAAKRHRDASVLVPLVVLWDSALADTCLWSLIVYSVEILS